MINEQRKEAILMQLEKDFPNSEISVTDDSGLHKGHKGHQGKGHFSIKIVSDSFTGMNRLQRHRMIYTSLQDLLKSDVHALAMKANTFEEINQ